MKVAIAGGHGKIALALTRLLSARGDTVLALVRKPEQFDDVRAAGGEPVLFDLENDSVEALASAVAGCDAVVFAAGAGPGSSAERKRTVDYEGAVKLSRAGVARYVLVSSIGADPDAVGDEVFSVYLRAKGQADVDVAASGADYTIIRPGPLTDAAPTGLVALGGDEVGRADITRADVAALVAACLVMPSTVGKTFVAVGGQTPIDTALAAL
jgi:uncharacterized protein YbjT (DUF2867 family)